MLVNQESISDKLRDASDQADQLLQKIETGGSYDEQIVKFQSFRTDLGNRRREIMRLLREAYGT
jgi:hypothetical protein